MPSLLSDHWDVEHMATSSLRSWEEEGKRVRTEWLADGLRTPPPPYIVDHAQIHQTLVEPVPISVEAEMV